MGYSKNNYRGDIMENFFIKLKRAMKEVNSRVATEHDTQKLRKLKDSQGVLAEIADYAFHFPKATKLQNKLKIFWNCNFDYAFLSENVGESYESVRVTISRVSRQLYDKLGSNWYYFIMGDKPLDAYIDFVIHSEKCGGINVFPVEYKDLFPVLDNNSGIYNLDDCKDELNFLQSITTISIKRQLENLDSDKLAFILSILNGKQASYGELQKILWFYIYGKKDFKIMINEIREQRFD